MDSTAREPEVLLATVQQSHYRTNRILTAGVVGGLALVVLILWWLDIDYPYHGLFAGLGLMLAAFGVHHIPYLSYRITRYRMHHKTGAEAIFAGGWRAYKRRIGQPQ